MAFIRRLKFIMQAGVDAIVALAVTIAGKLEALLGFLLTGGVAIAALLFVVWWLLPDDWQMKYAAKYMLAYDQVIIEHKPHNCEWGSSPIGEKHCHYKAIVTLYDSRGDVIRSDNTPPTKIHVEWERVED